MRVLQWDRICGIVERDRNPLERTSVRIAIAIPIRSFPPRAQQCDRGAQPPEARRVVEGQVVPAWGEARVVCIGRRPSLVNAAAVHTGVYVDAWECE